MANLESRTERILDAARELMLRYGYDKTTINDIAKATGVSKGTVYLHYASKEDLFEAVFWREIWTYINQTVKRVEGDSEPWTFVRMYEHGLLAIADSALMQALLQGDEHVLGSFLRKRGTVLVEFKQPYQSELLTIMQSVHAVRSDLDVEAAAYLLNVLAYGFLEAMAQIPADKRPPVERIVTEMSQMLQGYLVPPDGGDHEAGKQIVLGIFKRMREEIRMKLDKE
jgi:AcrR family transcriptional regulator